MKSIILSGLISTIGFTSCADATNPNQLDSAEIESKIERMVTLKPEIVAMSEFSNAEFQLFNVNGFSNSRTLLPGASSVDYKFVVKVKPSEIDKWTEGMQKIEKPEENEDWIKKLIEKRKSDWTHNSEPEYYERKGADVIQILYRQEGIVFKRVIAH